MPNKDKQTIRKKISKVDLAINMLEADEFSSGEIALMREAPEAWLKFVETAEELGSLRSENQSGFDEIVNQIFRREDKALLRIKNALAVLRK